MTPNTDLIHLDFKDCPDKYSGNMVAMEKISLYMTSSIRV